MGLGKTIQTLSFLQAVLCAEPLTWCKTALILCPMNTLHNWLRELSEWLDELERTELKTFSLNDAPTPKERVQVLAQWQKEGGIMVMGYDMYRLLASGSRTRVGKYKKAQKSALMDPGPDVIICDEGKIEIFFMGFEMNYFRTFAKKFRVGNSQDIESNQDA